MFYSDKNKKTKLTKITSTKSRINNFIFVSVLMLGPQLHSTTDNSLAKQLENYHQFNWTLLLKHQEELSEIKTINLCYNWLCEPQEEMWVAPELCPSMGIWPALKEKLQLCKNLEKLNLSLNGLFQLSPSGWINIIKSAEQWTKLKKLNLKGNTLSRLDDNGWEFIEALLITCRNLDHLNLGNNALYELSPEKWHFIGNILKNCDNLTRLKLGDNHLEKLDAKGWLNISNALKKIPNLKRLNFSGNSMHFLEIGSWKELIKSLGKCKTLETVKFHKYHHSPTKNKLEKNERYTNIKLSPYREEILKNHGFIPTEFTGTWQRKRGPRNSIYLV